MRGLYKKAPPLDRMETVVKRMELDVRLDSNQQTTKPALDKRAVGFDKVAYQREYMRKRRAAAKLPK